LEGRGEQPTQTAAAVEAKPEPTPEPARKAAPEPEKKLLCTRCGQKPRREGFKYCEPCNAIVFQIE